MASKKITKTDSEFLMFQDFYKLYQEYFTPEDSDEWWESVIRDVSSFIKNYSHIPLARGLGNALINALEMEIKK